jgi:hypothetical protein
MAHELEPGILYLRRQEDGLHAPEGALAPHTKEVHAQWREFGGEWGPPLGTYVPLATKRALAIIASGPHKHDEYRYIPVRDVPDTPAKAQAKAERIERLKSLPRKERPATESELVSLIRTGKIQTPLEVYASYKGASLVAKIEENCTVTYFGQSYKSLSAAASAAIGTVNDGKPLPANGFTLPVVAEKNAEGHNVYRIAA